MTYSLVRANTVAGGTAGPYTSPLSVTCTATVAGNLLVLIACIGNSPANNQFTTPASWSSASQTPSGTGALSGAIFYYPNNPGGVTSASLAGSDYGSAGATSILMGQILEFHDSAGSNPSPLDLSSVSSALTVASPATNASGATNFANELAISLMHGSVATATKDTFTTGSPFTAGGNQGNGVKTSDRAVADYLLDTGTAGSTVTDTITYTTQLTVFSKNMVTFAPATPPGQVPQRLHGRLNVRDMSAVHRRTYAMYGR